MNTPPAPQITKTYTTEWY